MLKRVFCCLLLLVLPVCAMAEECLGGFFLADSVNWEIAADEAAQLLGGDVQRSADSDPDLGSAEVLLASDLVVAGVPASKLIMTYYEDRLYSIYCYFRQTNVPDVQALSQALSGVLGEAEVYGAREYSLADMFSGSKTVYAWNPDELTEAKLVYLEPEQCYALSVVNTAVSAALEQALTNAGYMDGEEIMID